MLEFAKRIALEAGEIVKKYYYSEDLVIENKSEKDLVTEADRACEKFLVDKIKAEFPKHEILGEENYNNSVTSKDKRSETNNTYKWILDPIDGTTNFAHKVPIFGISIGLEKTHTDGTKEIIVGVVHNPITGELFYAEKGGGAYLEMISGHGIHMEPKKLEVSSQNKLSKSLLATGFHPGYPELMEENFRHFEKLQLASQTVRRLGAASIDLAYTAAGYFEGYWELKLKPWDLAAGCLLVTEAGGHITRKDGSQFSIYSEDILATNGHIHQHIQQYLSNQ